LMFGAGFNSDAGVVGSAVFQEDNFDILRFPTRWSDFSNGLAFRGAGQTFRAEVVPGDQVSRYNLSWRDPYFLGTDFSFGVDGFYYNRYYRDWTETRAGGRISVGYLIDRFWSAGVSLRLEDVEFGGYRAGAPQSYIDATGHNFLSTVQGRLTYDTRDSSFLPSSGHMLEASFEQAFNEFNYSRVDLVGSQYFTVHERADGGGKHILNFRGQASWTGDSTPVFEKLYAGGSSTFRGFEFRGVTPRTGGFRSGGNWLAIGTAEYTFPLMASDMLRGVVFSDFGTVEENIAFDDFRATAGFGFRVSVQALGPAPLAFDFAFPLGSQPFDNKQVFSFYAGASF